MAELKSATRPEHDSIEKRLNLMDSHMDLDQYRFLLERFYGVYARLVPELTQFEIDTTPEVTRLESLKRDLAFLNSSLSEIEIPPPSHFSPQNLEEALGMLYVLRGSSLGALVLSNHFQRTLKVSKGKGLDFFTGDAEETMPRWKKFKDNLEKISQQLDQDSIIVSAKRTFSLLENWLSPSR